ncbi:TetR/AcrR family transcriptional regulator [Photobacterium sp. MCCC 1A19761]|uniref:TetR/AcrR family transcriptional regulator n=1 Tax=Photobacterium sp. MCCC 1A19761 TaxID=3115000 RepID=UPI00307FAAD3
MKSRFKKEERYNQLLDLAIEIVRDQGTDALTLISLAKKAGVTKPITYNHFSNRQLLLFSLYRRCDEALSSQMDHLITNQSNNLKDAVTVYVSSYINCIETNGKLYDDIVSALKAYPEYASVENDIRDYYCHVIEKTFSPFVVPDGYKLTKLKLISIFSITESLGSYLKENPQNKDELIDEAVKIILSICNR